MPHANVLIVFDSRHGHTFQVAEALRRGIARTPEITARLVSYADVTPDDLQNARLIAIGGPTESLSASRHLKEFFLRFGAYDLHGKYGFAFDTHAPGRFRGSAARYIDRQFAAFGLRTLEPRRSAVVVGPLPGPTGEERLLLEPDAEKRFEALGQELGEELLRALAEPHPVSPGEAVTAA